MILKTLTQKLSLIYIELAIYIEQAIYIERAIYIQRNSIQFVGLEMYLRSQLGKFILELNFVLEFLEI